VTTTQVWQRSAGTGLAESGVAVAGACSAAAVASLTNPGAQSSPHGSPISTLQIVASGLALTYSAAGLPAGLSISSSTGAITGTPATAGLYSPVVGVTDALTGFPESAQFAWSVT
jgi:hypothetical protein